MNRKTDLHSFDTAPFRKLIGTKNNLEKKKEMFQKFNHQFLKKLFTVFFLARDNKNGVKKRTTMTKMYNKKNERRRFKKKFDKIKKKHENEEI